MLKIKKLTLILVLFLSSFAYANDAKVETEVLAVFQSLVNSSNNLDAKAYFQHFDSDKFIGLNSDGTNFNSIDDLIPLINAGFESIEEIISLDFTNVNVSVIDAHTAILVNEYSQSMRLKNQTIIHVSGGGTQVWSKRSGNWKLVSVSASNNPSLPHNK